MNEKKLKRFTMVLLSICLLFPAFVLPEGSVHAQADIVEINTINGYAQPDNDAPLRNWIDQHPVALDYSNTSLGADLGSPQNIARVELRAWSYTTSPRQTGGDYELYVSDNNEDYQLITNWTFSSSVVNGRIVHAFDIDGGVTARYIKCRSKYSDMDFTFAIQQSAKDVKVYIHQDPANLPNVVETTKKVGVLPQDSTPATGAVSDWTQTSPLDLDINTTSIVIDAGGGKTIGKIELRDNDATSRVRRVDYAIYESNDNETYNQVNYWTFTSEVVDGNLVHGFVFPNGFHSRYIKIKTDYTDTTGATFVLNNPQTDVKLFRIPSTTTFTSIEVNGSQLVSKLAQRVGSNAGDSMPMTGTLANWQSTASFVLDEQNRSVGVDLQYVRAIGALELRSSGGATRLNDSNYSLYQSDNNVDYTLVDRDQWLFSSFDVPNGIVHRFNFANLHARYLKVTTNYSDTSGTFLLANLQEGIQAYSAPIVTSIPALAGYLDQDSSPATGLLQHWGYDGMLAIDQERRSVGVDLGFVTNAGKIELWDANTAAELHRSDFNLYASDDNVSYTPVTNWIYQAYNLDDQIVHIFEFTDVRARYIKINSNSVEANASISLAKLQKDIHVYTVSNIPQKLTNQLQAIVGYLRNDTAPYAGAISSWNFAGPFSFDQINSSVGADLGSKSAFNQIVLYDQDDETRLQKTDLSLYVSDDNVTYTKIEDWDIKRQDEQMVLYNFKANARYVKVHQHFNTSDPTFEARGGDLQLMMTVLAEPEGRWIFSGGDHDWQYRKAVTVDNSAAEAVYDRAVFISELELNTASLVAAGKMSPRKDDVRFVDNSGKELHYYMADNGFYVRIPYLAPSSQQTIYMYYGNDQASGVSDGLNTFQVEYGNRTIAQMPAQAGQNKEALLPDGRFIEAFNQNGSVYVRLSEDHGQTWEQPVKVPGTETLGSMLVLENGDILIPFIKYRNYQTTNCLSECLSELYVTRSSDAGLTWTTPTQVDTGSRYNSTTTNPIELANGNIILPYYYAYTDEGASRISVMISTDGGDTWTKSVSDLEIPGTGYEIGASEPAAVQFPDGQLVLLFRTQGAGRYHLGQSKSMDNGRTWSSVTDSVVYSSNTAPALMKHNDHVLLLWSGNNAFGGESYYRTPLNLAYSADDAVTWSGYKDVLARTPYNSPEGFGLFTQPDFGIAADGSMTMNWAYKFIDWYTMRIEDFERWLYQSHGGFSDFESNNLPNNYWWALSENVKVSADHKITGKGALQLRDTYTYALTEATRSFGTGIRQGSVKFKLYADNLSSGYVVTLKESYSQGLEAPGSMFELYAAPDGSLKYRDTNGDWLALPTVAQLALNTWHDIEIRFDTDTNEAEVILDGQSKGTIGYYQDENMINYFHISSEDAAVAGTNVFIDDLIIQDTHIPLPIAAAVGAEEGTVVTPPTSGRAVTGEAVVSKPNPVEQLYPNRVHYAAKEVKVDVNGKYALSLTSGKEGFTLPGNIGQLTEDHPLAVTVGQMVMTLPASWLQQMMEGIPSTERDESRISIVLQQADEAEASSLLQPIGNTEKAELTSAGAMFRLSVSILAKDGKEQIVPAFGKQLQVALPMGAAANPELSGMYAVGEDDSLVYFGGAAKEGVITVNLSAGGRYAVIQYDKKFNDVPHGHWAETAIKALSAKQAIKGISAQAFAPSQNVTRAQFAVMLARMLQLQPNSSALEQASGDRFSDVSADQWSAAEIAAAVEAGIIRGIDATHFDPDRNITRQEMAVMLVRAYEYMTPNKNGEETALPEVSFVDGRSIKEWAKHAVKAAIQLGLLDPNGRGGGKFMPEGLMTRAECAVVLYRLYTNGK